MHILILGSFAPSLLNFRGPLIQSFISRGHRVSVGAPDIAEETRNALIAFGAEVYDTPLDRNGTGMRADLTYGVGLWRLMGQIKPDAVLTYTVKPNIWGAYAAKLRGCASYAMVTGLGYLFTDTDEKVSLKKRTVQLIARKMYRVATSCNTRVIFQNPDDIADFQNAGCLKHPSKAAMVNGSGVDMTHYKRSPLPKGAAFTMIARLLKAKGVREYAQASIALKAQYPDTRFRLVGYFDDGQDSIPRAVLDDWIAQGLEYSGPMDDVRTALDETSVYVLPSYREGTPRSVLEAMAMGRAIITSDAPGCRETVRVGETGFLVPPRDVGALQLHMEMLINDDKMRADMGAASYELAREKYVVGAVNAAVQEILGL